MCLILRKMTTNLWTLRQDINMYKKDKQYIKQTAESWVIDKADQWRDHYSSNYEKKFDEYYRLWHGLSVTLA